MSADVRTPIYLQGRRLASVLERWNCQEDALVAPIRNHPRCLRACAADVIRRLRWIQVDPSIYKLLISLQAIWVSERGNAKCGDFKQQGSRGWLCRCEVTHTHSTLISLSRPIFDGLESKFGLVFPKLASTSSPVGQ